MDIQVFEQQKKQEQSAFVKGLKDFTAGSVGGFVCKSVEYPLDTVKVILQTEKKGGQTALQAFRNIIAANGVRGLYKGLTSPLLGSMAENATLFTCYGFMRGLLGTSSSSSSSSSSSETTQPKDQRTLFLESLPAVLLSGAVAGIFVTGVLTPVELLKCRMQVQSRPGAPQLYKNPWDCVVKTVRTEGITKGLFKGASATLLREIPGNAAWFGVYETMCYLQTPTNGTKDMLAPTQLMLAGGLSGMAYWSAFFPADTVKSRMQTDPAMSNMSFRTAFVQIYKSSGFRALYRGWGLTVSRAMPSNALLFLTFEVMEKMLRNV